MVMAIVIFLVLLLTVIGLLMYSHFADCDPLVSGQITESNEVLLNCPKRDIKKYSILVVETVT